MSVKEDLRRRASEALRTLSIAERARHGAQIDTRLWALPEVKSAQVILLYASLPSEVPTEPLATEARLRGIEVVYPRCLPEGRVMTLHAVASETDLLEPGRYGLREPAPDCPRTEASAIDVAFIPGLAWDRHGGRLGRGAGYYDRLLASPGWRAFRCGLFFAIQEVEAIPMDPWDIRLDAIVTEHDVVRAG